jgi:hypothetical protein
MIVVVGQPIAITTRAGTRAGGLAASVALSAATAGASVQLVTRIVDDPTGDELLRVLTGGGVGHVATLRQPATADGPVLDPADLELALRYLTNVGVLVLTEYDPALAAVAIAAADWNHASLIVLLRPGTPVPGDLPSTATVLATPAADPDDAFGSLVGTFAAALDRGVDAATAFRTTIAEAGGWSPASG